MWTKHCLFNQYLSNNFQIGSSLLLLYICHACVLFCFFLNGRVVVFFLNLLIHLFIFGCVGSSFLCEGFLQLRPAGATPFFFFLTSLLEYNCFTMVCQFLLYNKVNQLHSSSWCAGLSLSRPLLLRSTGSRCAGSVVVAHGPSCSVACGVFPDQGSNPCPLHWQADSQPLRHQGSPMPMFLLAQLRNRFFEVVLLCERQCIHNFTKCFFLIIEHF